MKNKTFLLGLLITIGLIFAGCSRGEEPEISKSDELLDGMIFDQAVESTDRSKCSEIKAAASRDECEKSVASLTMTDLAKSKVDASLCDNIELDRYKSTCIASVQAIEDELNRDKNIVEVSEKALETLDITKCDEISDQTHKDECLLNIYSDSSYPNRNQSLCDSIQNNTLKQVCVDTIMRVESATPPDQSIMPQL